MDALVQCIAQMATCACYWGQALTRSNTMLRVGLISSNAGATVCLVLGGCSGLNLPELEPESTASLHEAPIVGSPTDIYARVARGALACWLGKAGPLEHGYVYHADAEPPAKGGKAKIVIHERDPSVENPRGLRAFRISIVPDGESSKISVENLKLPEPLSKSMENDVHRWARGDIGCLESNTDGEWAPKPPERPKTKKKPSGKKGGEHAT